MTPSQKLAIDKLRDELNMLAGWLAADRLAAESRGQLFFPDAPMSDVERRLNVVALRLASLLKAPAGWDSVGG